MNTHHMNWKNTNAVVTGGSRGLGAALAEELSAQGAGVVLVARGAQELERVVRELQQRGRRVYGVVADVADKNATHRIAALATEYLGRVDLLIHNASTLGPTPLRSLLDTACEDLAAVLETNVIGPFRLTKALAGPMVLRRTGTVVHVSSDAAVEGYPTWGAYGASKAAGDQLHRVLAAELQSANVRVVNIDPGEMDTRMHADAVPDADRASLQRPEVVARTVRRILETADVRTGARVSASTFMERAS